jgi:NAD-dependent DNA ligase
MLANRAGIQVHPRVTKKVTLLVDCDPTSRSGNERKAADYGIPVVSEREFWAALGLEVTAS